MTRQRNDEHSTEFGLWLRKQPSIDSGLGYVTTNLDYVWENYHTGKWMMIEEKRYRSQLTYPQGKQFAKLDLACRSDPNYHGFHLVQFEHTSPDDGLIWLDYEPITKEKLLAFLASVPLTNPMSITNRKTCRLKPLTF